MPRNPVNCEPTVVNQKIWPQVQKNNNLASCNWQPEEEQYKLLEASLLHDIFNLKKLPGDKISVLIYLHISQ